MSLTAAKNKKINMKTTITPQLKSDAASLGFLTRLLWPLSPVSTGIFSLAMLVVPLLLSVRNFGIGSDPSTLALSNAALQLDLLWMHLVPDIIACMFGAWSSFKASSRRSLISPPWRGGSLKNDLRRYALPLGKGMFISLLIYCLSCLPAIIQTLAHTSGPSPLPALLMGACEPALLFALGFTLGVLMESRWSLAAAFVLSALLCWAGLMLFSPTIPSGKTFPRQWGSALGIVLPIIDTGMGSEPGITINPLALASRYALLLAFTATCLAACLAASRLWRLSSSSWLTSSVAILILVPALIGGTLAWSGPKIWIRSASFTPLCTEIPRIQVSVCSHPDDKARNRRYYSYMRSAAGWFPQSQPSLEKSQEKIKNITLLLGNSFTSTQTTSPWNLSRRGLSLVKNRKGLVLQVSTDTLTQETAPYSDLARVMAYLSDHRLHAPCAQNALQKINNLDRLTTGPEVTAYIFEQLPQRMASLAYSKNGGSPQSIFADSSQDKTVQLLQNSPDSRLQSFVAKNLPALEKCTISPQEVSKQLEK